MVGSGAHHRPNGGIHARRVAPTGKNCYSLHLNILKSSVRMQMAPKPRKVGEMNANPPQFPRNANVATIIFFLFLA
jgi:hypothetical protein